MTEKTKTTYRQVITQFMVQVRYSMPVQKIDAVGGASGWIGGIGRAGTLIILLVLGKFVDIYGQVGTPVGLWYLSFLVLFFMH